MLIFKKIIPASTMINLFPIVFKNLFFTVSSSRFIIVDALRCDTTSIRLVIEWFQLIEMIPHILKTE